MSNSPNPRGSHIVSRSPPPSASSAEKIRSKFLRKIGIESTPLNMPMKRSVSSAFSSGSISVLCRNAAVGECILRLEPLKIGLESDDDESSVDSFADSTDACALSCCLDAHGDIYHNKPKSVLPSSSAHDINVSVEGSSGRSLPSLVGSVASTISGCSTSPNKKARYLSNRPRKKRKSVSIYKSVSVVPIPSRNEYSDRVRERIWTTGAEIHANAARNTLEFCSENWQWSKALEDEHMFVHQANGERIHPIHVHNAMAHIRACERDPGNEEEIQFNLSLISCLLPPVAVVSTTCMADNEDIPSSNQQPIVGPTSSSTAAA